MANQKIWIGIAVGVFFVGIAGGYALLSYADISNPQFMSQYMQNPQQRQQIMSQMIQNPEYRQQMTDQMIQNKEFMQELAQNQQFKQGMKGPMMSSNGMMTQGMKGSSPMNAGQMDAGVMNNQQFLQQMQPLWQDPEFKEQMIEQMLQRQQFMQELRQNSQFMQQLNK